MKTQSIYLLVFFIMIPFFALSQVGIGTVTPNAQLEIKSSNQSTPSNTDGIIIPKIDEFPSSNPGVSQDGMMVYITGTGTATKGFYYWDNANSSWLSLKGADEINGLNDGKADGSSIFLGSNSGSNDDGTSNDNTGLGVQALRENTSGRLNVAIGNGALILNTTGNANVALGRSALIHNVTQSSNVGIGHQTLYWNEGDSNVALGYNSFLHKRLGTNSVALGALSGQYASGDDNVFLGAYAGSGTGLHTKSGSVFVGSFAGYNELSSNKLYIENSSTSSPLIYGEFDNDVLRVNGTLQVGDPSGSGYIFPTNRGTVNQVLKTNASGNVSWVNVTSFGAENINDLTDGKTDTNNTSIFLGNNSGASDDDTSNYNIGIGPGALQSNVSGSNNIAIGENVLSMSTSTGSDNIGIGTVALRENSGMYNVSVGGASMLYNILGEKNVALGRRALYGNNGSNNVAVGWRAGHTSGTGSNNVFIGSEAGHNETGSNKLYIENTIADANSALVYGEFDTNLFKINGLFKVSNPVGSGTDHFEVRDNGNSYFGGATFWKQNNTSGTTVASMGNIGDDGFLSVNNGGTAQHFIYGGGTTAFNLQGIDSDFQISGDSSSYLFYMDASTDRIGIGTATPNTTLHIAEGVDASLATNTGFVVIGDLTGQNMVIDQNEIITRLNGANSTLYLNQTGGDVWAGGALVHSSDRRLKRDISPLEYGLSEVMKLKPKQYFWKNRGNQKQESLGFIAQDVQGVIKNIVHENNDEQKTLSISYTELIPVLVNAIQEQQKQIESLKTEIISIKDSTSNNYNK